MAYTIHTLPAFKDNYLWLIADETSRHAIVVDPGDATVVAEALATLDLTLSAILVTHHHADHIGGVDALVAAYGAPVYGPDSPNIPQVNRPLRDGQQCAVSGLIFDVIAVPGHTLDHIAYFNCTMGPDPVVFCGDTLFAGGCGRLFEGTPDQMSSSLDRLAALPGNTLVYCAHEYTLANLRFAMAVEPDNQALRLRLADATALRAQNLPTVPSHIDLELATNPFLRCHIPSVATAAKSRLADIGSDRVAVFAAIRQWKDGF